MTFNLTLLFWFCVFIVTLVIEIVTTALVSIWFIPSAIVCMILSLFDIPIWIQILVFASISLILLILTKPISDKLRKRPIERTNIDMLIDSIVLLKEEIPDCFNTGVVIVGDIEWLAKSNQHIPANSKVKIKEINGVILFVEPIVEQETKENVISQENS